MFERNVAAISGQTARTPNNHLMGHLDHTVHRHMPLHNLEDVVAMPGNQLCKVIDVTAQDPVDTLRIIGHERRRSCETTRTPNLNIILHPPSGPQKASPCTIPVAPSTAKVTTGSKYCEAVSVDRSWTALERGRPEGTGGEARPSPGQVPARRSHTERRATCYGQCSPTTALT